MTDNDKKTKCRQAEPALPKKARYLKARRAYRRQAPAAKRQTKTGSYRVSYPNDLRTLRTKTIRAAP